MTLQAVTSESRYVKYFTLLLYIITFSVHAVVVKMWTKQSIKLPTPLLVCIVEAVKALVSLVAFVYERCYTKETGFSTYAFKEPVQSIYHNFVLQEWKFCVPALLYALYNNVSFVNIGHYDPEVYSVLMNTRIILTAMLWRWIFGKSLSIRTCISLVFLTLGCVLAHLNCKHSWQELNGRFSSITFDMLGFSWILFQASLSCLAGVYNEVLLKGSNQLVDVSLNRQNFVLYSMGCVFNGLLLPWYDIGFSWNWSAFDALFWSTVALLVVGGLCAAHILKHFSAVTKSYATAAEILLTGLIGYQVLDIVLGYCFWASFFLIAIALILYNLEEKTCLANPLKKFATWHFARQWRACLILPFLLSVVFTGLSIGHSNSNVITGKQTSRSDQWLRIWEGKGSGSSAAPKHIMNGFSQLSKQQWDQMVCTLLNKSSHGKSGSRTLKIVEFGCGAGAFVESAMTCLNCTSSTCDVHGVDYSSSLISAASSSNFWKYSGNFHRADIADASVFQRIGIKFDLILSHSVFLYLDDYEHASRVIAVMKQFLALSGEIIISDIPNLHKQAQDLEMRRKSTYYQIAQPRAIKNFAVDHLYFDKSFFKLMEAKHGLRILEITDESNLPLSFYEPSAYRFLVRMSHAITPQVTISKTISSQPAHVITPETATSEEILAYSMTSRYSILFNEQQPSTICAGDTVHPFDIGRDGLMGIQGGGIMTFEPQWTCDGPQFTHVKTIAKTITEVDVSDCPRNPRWATAVRSTNLHPNPKKDGVDWRKSDSWDADWTGWTRNTTVPRSKTPGVDWVYTACDAPWTLSKGTYTNLRLQPYRIKKVITSKESRHAPSVLLLYVDSLSNKRLELDLPETTKFLRSLPNAHIFEHTSVFGFNTMPNIQEWGMRELFQAALHNSVVPSVFEDYCPDHGVCSHFPVAEYKVCSKLLCNYGSDLVQLGHFNRNPLCVHGEFWVNHHVRFVQQMW
eukprot:CAMPEP_0173074976 /NCGR_PEP_ID=MMETSP1102-20130122/11338_1 /TAXON_ID=49646 /ORGANISM="Geminigera sp., Strain Caron Lab Isolate" /LENGTH=965 /DNA_ID=CAMNT_0013944149 /DNA_START=117 /DNA_END=3011 /DNA_ORIENTATION=-